MTDLRTSTLEVPGAVLTYDVRSNGSGTEPVLLMIASPMGAAGFGTLSEYFTDRTVVTYDPRGAERSTLSDGAPESTPEVHAEDLHQLIATLDAGPVDLFASSGGANNALALVGRHPEQVRTLVAHEPPLAQLLPDREEALAAIRDIDETYQRYGLGPGMAKFIAIVMHKGPVAADFADQPAPDPSMFGLPTEDDGSRDDVLLGQNLVTNLYYHPDFEALRRCFDPRRHRRRRGVGGRTGPSWSGSSGRTARDESRHLPQRPWRFPGGRIRPDRRPRGFRGKIARGARHVTEGGFRFTGFYIPGRCRLSSSPTSREARVSGKSTVTPWPPRSPAMTRSSTGP